jgi:hypothetical protein
VEREDQIQPEIEPIGASMQYRGRSDRRRIQLNLRAPAFVKFVNDIERDRRDLVEELPSKATSLQDMTTLLGIIFAAKVDPLFVIRRVTLMESFRKKNDGLGSNRLIQKQIGREVSRNEMHIEPAAIRSEENLKAGSAICNPILTKEEKEISRVRQTARHSNRRRKVRVYFP